jgi:NAD-dependent dihydropyrimidine dehydrogenase PreA subunit
VPVVDRNRCEAKADCVAVCPYHVFELRALAPSDREGQSWLGRLKTWAHGGRQAYVVRPDDCHACQRCVEACPEDAIRLAPAR